MIVQRSPSGRASAGSMKLSIGKMNFPGLSIGLPTSDLSGAALRVAACVEASGAASVVTEPYLVRASPTLFFA